MDELAQLFIYTGTPDAEHPAIIYAETAPEDTDYQPLLLDTDTDELIYGDSDDPNIQALFLDPATGTIAYDDIPEPVYTNRLYYTVVEGGTKPESTWITENCSDNVFDAETGNGYLVLKDDVTTLVGGYDEDNDIYYTIFKDIDYNPDDEDNNISEVIIPNGITEIGDYAFFHYTSLTSVTIPNSVTSIGNNTFTSCTGLTSVTIPNSVTSIDSNAFYHCASLTSVTIPNSVTSIGSGAFYECASLNSVIIPNSVTSIGSDVFYGCTSLTSVTIPNSVTSIDSNAFASCTSLTSVTIPNSVTSIGSNAFNGCKNLASVTCFATTPPTLGANAFANIDTTTCGVPEASISAYQGDASWSAAFTTFVAADV